MAVCKQSVLASQNDTNFLAKLAGFAILVNNKTDLCQESAEQSNVYKKVYPPFIYFCDDSILACWPRPNLSTKITDQLRLNEVMATSLKP